jgi:ATP-binding cassette subfamily C (CFTR/MRP) protein 4
VYYDADLYVLDDPLSAVDTEVARQLLENCIVGFLKGKTVILVTHQIQFVKYCSRILVIENGSLVDNGTVESIMESDSQFSTLLENYPTKEIEEKDENEIKYQDINISPNQSESFGNEESAVGSVPWTTYWRYFRSGSSLGFSACVVVTMAIGQGLIIYSDFWLASWATAAGTHSNSVYAYVLIGLACASFFVGMSRAYMFLLVCLRSGKKSFDDMLNSVFKAPMVFFQTNPQGRVMKYFYV